MPSTYVAAWLARATREALDDVVALDLPEPAYARLKAHAVAERVELQVAFERILLAALDVPEPAFRLAKLGCDRCGPRTHRFVRARAAGGGTYVFLFGCPKCYRLRPHGAARVWPPTAPTPVDAAS